MVAEARDLLNPEQAHVLLAKRLHSDLSITITDVCKTLKISRSTYYHDVALDCNDLPLQLGFVQSAGLLCVSFHKSR